MVPDRPAGVVEQHREVAAVDVDPQPLGADVQAQQLEAVGGVDQVVLVVVHQQVGAGFFRMMAELPEHVDHPLPPRGLAAGETPREKLHAPRPDLRGEVDRSGVERLGLAALDAGGEAADLPGIEDAERDARIRGQHREPLLVGTAGCFRIEVGAGPGAGAHPVVADFRQLGDRLLQ